MSQAAGTGTRFLGLVVVFPIITSGKVGPEFVPPETKTPDLWYPDLSAGLEGSPSVSSEAM